MYHRRLLLLAVVMSAAMLPLLGQAMRLTLGEGSEHRDTARSALERREYLPTWRGTIRDRHDRVLAADRPTFALSMHYSLLTGQWAEEEAAAQVRREAGRQHWSNLSAQERTALTDERAALLRPVGGELVDAIARVTGIDRAELARRMEDVVARVGALAQEVWTEQEKRERAKYAEDPTWRFVARPIREQESMHVIVPAIATDMAIELRSVIHAHQDGLDGLAQVADAREREHPWSRQTIEIPRDRMPSALKRRDPLVLTLEGVGDHLIGDVRDVWPEEVRARPFRPSDDGEPDLGGYALTGDQVGGRGLERAFESLLRGERGRLERRLDTAEVRRLDPEPGTSIRSTIDIVLQARIEAILDPALGLTVVQPFHEHPELPVGTELSAAAVVIEIETGEVLASASMPRLADISSMSADQQAARPPRIDRSLRGRFPPGSIVKPLIYVSAVSEGVLPLDEHLECRGHYFPDAPDRLRCWIFREKYSLATHGVLSAQEALARSCNIAFYTMADRMGSDAVLEWYRAWGAGSVLALASHRGEILFESGRGDLPDEEEISRLRAGGSARFETILMGIGQGPITWSPMHAANAYATLARSGLIRDAHLVSDPAPDAPLRTANLDLDPEAVRIALAGLRDGVEKPWGTSHHMRMTPESEPEPIVPVEGVVVWAKTGTAQAPRWDADGSGALDDAERARPLDHAWFVGMVAAPDSPRPLYAIAVLVEHGGSGGRVAGPVAAQIIRALQTERYLPDRRTP